MISFEMIYYLKWKHGKTSFMDLKLDMSIAYDTIKWKFLQAIIRKMGFNERWIQIIMSCIESTGYLIIHGEEIFDHVKPL